MFIFRSQANSTLIITFSGDQKNSRFHLEPEGTGTNIGYTFLALCKKSTPEQWVKYFKFSYGWNVDPVKLIEVEWE